MTQLVGCTIALPSNNDLNGIAQLAERLGVTVLRFAAKSGHSDGSSSNGMSTARPVSVNPDKTPTDGATFALESWLDPLVNDIDDIIVLSPQGIRLLVELASQLHRESQLLRALSGVRRIAYGARPAAALRELGISATITSQLPSLPSLREALESEDLSGRAVGLIPRASDPELLELITEKGGLPRILAPLDDILISPTPALVKSVIGARIQVLVFSTPEQVRDVWRQGSQQHSAEELRQALERTRVIAVGANTVRALEQIGVGVQTSCTSSELACASSKQIADLLALGGFVDLPLVVARMGTPPTEINDPIASTIQLSTPEAHW